MYKLIWRWKWKSTSIEIPVSFLQNNINFFKKMKVIQRQQVNGVDRPDEWANQLNLSQLTIAKPGVKVRRDKLFRYT